MRPAFGSTQSAAAFALLLLVVLLSPVLAGKKFMPPREESYSRQSWGSGPYPWIQQQIFHETNDIDIAFVGSSHMFNDIDTPYVQAELSKKLGRPAVVRSIAWGGAGYDALFFITRDLLQHRRVKLLVFYDEVNGPGTRHNQTPAWVRFGDDVALLAGMNFREQSLFYFSAIVGMPRNLLSLVRPNLPAPLVSDKPNRWEQVGDAPNPALRLGSFSYHRGFGLQPPADATAFVEFKPVVGATPADAVIFSAATKTNFSIAAAPLPEWQVYFCNQLKQLFQAHQVRPVMLHLPVFGEVRSPVLAERADWPQVFGGDFTLLGIPPAKLFGGLSDEQVRWLYGDPAHFNCNGQEYFTPLITPALFQIYEEAP